MKTKRARRSSLREKALRNPGESLNREIDRFINEDIGSYAVVCIFLVAIIALEWFRFIFELPPSPKTVTVAGGLLILVFIYRVFVMRCKLQNLRLGRDGEKVVGQHLDQLREQGTKILHDVPAQDFNLDHVIVSATGIFVVETKTYSKPFEGNEKLVFDGTHVTLAGENRTDKPIIQATAAANWLRELLRQSTGKQFNVKPVVVFPGWYVESTPEAKLSDVWVLNPKALPTIEQA